MSTETYMAKPCEFCDGPMTDQRWFLPNGYQKKYCSSRCRQRAFQARRLEDIPAEEIERRFNEARRQIRRSA